MRSHEQPIPHQKARELSDTAATILALAITIGAAGLASLIIDLVIGML